jgi:hypothetical protein
MQIIGDIAGLLARLLDAGGGGGNEFGARFGLDGQGGNDVNHEKSSRLFFWIQIPGGTLDQPGSNAKPEKPPQDTQSACAGDMR